MIFNQRNTHDKSKKKPANNAASVRRFECEVIKKNILEIQNMHNSWSEKYKWQKFKKYTSNAACVRRFGKV